MRFTTEVTPDELEYTLRMLMDILAKNHIHLDFL